MPHTTEFKGYRKIANGQFALDFLCCGEHEHPHTVGSEVMANPQKLKASMEWAHKQAQLDHDAAQKLDAHLQSLVGSKVEHE